MTQHMLALKREINSLINQMSQKLDSKSPEALKEWKALDVRVSDLREQLLDAEACTVEGQNYNRGTHLPNVGTENITARSALSEARSTPSYNRAFNNWLRHGTQDPELRTLSEAGNGQVLVPSGFQRELENKLQFNSGMRQVCRLLKTDTGNPLPWPTEDDTANTGEFLDESAAISFADPTFGSVSLGAHLASSKAVKVPVELVQDSALNLQEVLVNSFGRRLGKITNNQFTTGSANPITGLVTALVSAGGRNVLLTGANSNSGNAGDNDLNSIGTDDFSNILANVDEEYRSNPNCKWMFHQNTLDKLRKVKDKYGRPILNTSLSQDDPKTILGYGWQINNSVAQVGAGNISVLFGDFSKFVIRDVAQLTLVVYRELFMQNHQIGFEAYLRCDARLLQAAAFAYGIHPLS